MTDAQKENIRYLRGEGLGYRAIAARLGISENTVKSFCRRNNLTGVASKEPPQVCRQCGQPLAKAPKRKERKFCSEACRRAWWKAHPELVDRKAFYTLTCAECGKEFSSYGNRKRNIVLMPAISKRVSGKGAAMTKEQFDREKKYQAALAVARSMLRQKVIDEEDFLRIEARLKEKFNPVLGGFLF